MKLNGLTIVIPALNEAATIDAVVRRCLEIAESVVVVDDGSTDTTGQISESAGAIVLHHERAQGYDAAIADGLNKAFSLGARAAITCDADGQHHGEDVHRIARPVLAGEVDICAGVRDHYNRPIEAVVGIVSAVLFDTRDPFCGLKCYSKRFYEICGDFPPNLNIGTLPLVWMRRYALKHRFLPIQTNRRRDKPRFGTFVKANAKLAYAFSRSAFNALNWSSKL